MTKVKRENPQPTFDMTTVSIGDFKEAYPRAFVQETDGYELTRGIPSTAQVGEVYKNNFPDINASVLFHGGEVYIIRVPGSDQFPSDSENVNQFIPHLPAELYTPAKFGLKVTDTVIPISIERCNPTNKKDFDLVGLILDETNKHQEAYSK